MSSQTPQATKVPDKPLTIKDAINLDKEDCLSCRLIGSAAFIGLGGYTYFSGMTQLESKRVEIARSNTKWGIGARRLGIQGMAVTMLGLGLYRFFI